jgi:Flp pilus assembly protein TadG
MNSKTKDAQANEALRKQQHRWVTQKRRASHKRRAGSVLVMVALSFVVLCGFTAFATDYGQMVWWRNQLQRACDASALAGASQLPFGDDAKTVAETVGKQNGVPAPTISWPNGTKQIRVTATREVKFGFAKMIGLSSGTVSASAVAGRIALKGVPGNVPLAITTDDYNRYKNGTSFETRLVDNNRQDFNAGTLVALDLRFDNNGKSPAQFEDDLDNGSPETVHLNQQINSTLNASLSAQGPKMEDAIMGRINAAAAAPYYDTGSRYVFPKYPDGDPRVVTIIIADPNPQDNSNPMVTARAIVPVYIESVRSPGNSDNYYLHLRILPGIPAYGSEDPGIEVGDDSTPDTGLAVVKLVG